MANDRDALYVTHIMEAIRLVEQYAKGLDWDEFLADKKTQDAIVRQLEIIGEAAKRLSRSFTDAVDLPWKEITGMRDKLSHDYMEVDLETVWITVKSDLREVKRKLRQ